MDINEMLKVVMFEGASDLHITVGLKPMIRVNGELVETDFPLLEPADTQELVMQIVKERHKKILEEKGEVDLSYTYPGLSRFRVNAYRQRGSYAMALRAIPMEVPDIEDLYLPEVLRTLANKRRGIILVTGPTGSGKSTTLAAMINHINNCLLYTSPSPRD